MISRAELGCLATSSGLVYFTDALERVAPDDLGDVAQFKFGGEGEIDVSVARLHEPKMATANPSVTAAIFLRARGTEPVGSWRRLRDRRGDDAAVFSQGTAILGVAAENLNQLYSLQADPGRLIPLVREVSTAGPRCMHGLIVVDGAVDGPLPCWGAYEADETLAALMIDIDPFIG